jgi:hypothetical protein
MLTMDLPASRTLTDRIAELGQEVAVLVKQVDQELAGGITPTRRGELRARALELAGEANQVRVELLAVYVELGG